MQSRGEVSTSQGVMYAATCSGEYPGGTITLHAIDLESGNPKSSTHFPKFACDADAQGLFPPASAGLAVNEKTGDVYYYYAATQGMTQCLRSIHAMNPAAGTFEKVLELSYPDFENCPFNGILFSHEDQSIIIARDSSLYVYNVESRRGHQVNLTSHGASGLSALAPAGKQAVYAFFNPSTRVPTHGQSIKKVDVSSGSVTNVTSFLAPGKDVSYPVAFSLDESANSWTIVNMQNEGQRSYVMSLYNFDFTTGALPFKLPGALDSLRSRIVDMHGLFLPMADKWDGPHIFCSSDDMNHGSCGVGLAYHNQ